MPPTGCGSGRDEMKTQIQALIDSNQVMVFSKSYCPFCVKVKDLFKELNVAVHAVELDLIDEGSNFQDILLEITGQKTVPNVFVNKTHVGGCDKTLQAHKDGTLQKLLEGSNETYEYDLIVIGGGSGGLACSKEAATLGKKVLVLDYVVPTPKGTTWGLGGTCVNVGCIPKKLMHQAALLGTALKDSRNFGWEYEEKVKHNWQTMIESISNYIGSLNWGYRVELRDKNVTYMNSYAEFVEPHKIKHGDAVGQTPFELLAASLATPPSQSRPPVQLSTSDDLFSLPYCPGKTLVIGASYVALECAGFLAGIGLDVTVMVRSILLRGFDQEMAERAGTYMKDHGVKFIRPFVPTKIEQLEEGTPGKLKVIAKSTESGEMIEGEYNTVLIAVGRDACTGKIGLDKVGVEINENPERTMENGDHSLDFNTAQEDMMKSFNSLAFGLRFMKMYDQPKHRTNIMGVTYNSKNQRLIILDSRGCSSWYLLPGSDSIKREINFPKYQFSILKKMIYCKKFNVYFGLGKDYSVKVYNMDFCEIESADDENSHLVMTLVFNPVTEELITGGLDGIKILSRFDGTKLCIVPPPPFVSPIQKAPNFVYSRESGIVVVLLSSWEVWVYTARSDYTIKLWDFQKTLVLVADVHLDDSFTSACFLNSSGDILVAFKNHLFLLPHHKLMHVNLIDDRASETSAQVYEQMRLSPRPGHPGESVLDKLQIGISPERLSPTPIPPKEPETEEQRILKNVSSGRVEQESVLLEGAQHRLSSERKVPFVIKQDAFEHYKCWIDRELERRYVLLKIKSDTPDISLPTAFEERLLMDRFTNHRGVSRQSSTQP
ncbi:UNVERIFIED_CONTAM: hypothetical protein FKN15_024465 [Acipenser sinensis]